MPRPDSSPITERILDHLGLIVSAITLVFIGLRVLGLAMFDVPTALGIIQLGGAASLAIGAAIASLAQAVSGAAVAAGSVLLLAQSHDHSDEAYDAVFTAWGPLTLLALAIGVWPAAVLALLLGGAAAVRQAVRKKHPRSDQRTLDDDEQISRAPKERPRSWFLMYSAVTLWLILTSLLPWLPAEKIDTSDEPPMTAYVLSETDSTLAILRDEGRRIDRIDKRRLVGREVCRDRSTWSDPLVRLLWPTNYAKCPR